MTRWWRERTLRFRLATWYALGGTLLLSIFSATVYFYVQRWVARPLDEPLREDVARVRAGVVLKSDGSLWWKGELMDKRRPVAQNDPWFELWDDQHLVLRHWPFDDEQLDRVPVAPLAGRETLSIYNISPELRLRMLATPFPGPTGAPWMVRVMRIHEPATGMLRALLVILLVALPVVVALLVCGGYIITRRWLKPLDVIVAEATRITAEDLSRRLPVANSRDELGRLATVFNVTLDRLERSFVALDRFVADASHELRTPLTTLRSVGEVGLRRSRTPDEYREIIGSMLEEAQRLQVLIQRLLELASAEGGSPSVQWLTIKLDAFVAACSAELGVLAETRNQRITVQPGGGAITTDPVLLRQALQNLIDNALKYGPVDSEIRVEVQSLADEYLIRVLDRGPGIDASLRERLTDRFFRGDHARRRSPAGYGLGLAITKAHMRTLGGKLDCIPREGGGAIFVLHLPRR